MLKITRSCRDSKPKLRALPLGQVGKNLEAEKFNNKTLSFSYRYVIKILYEKKGLVHDYKILAPASVIMLHEVSCRINAFIWPLFQHLHVLETDL